MAEVGKTGQAGSEQTGDGYGCSYRCQTGEIIKCGRLEENKERVVQYYVVVDISDVQGASMSALLARYICHCAILMLFSM